MATSLAGRMYEMVLQRKHQHGATCMGPDCFRYTFLIVAALSLVVTLLAFILWLRTRDMYATIIQVSRPPVIHFSHQIAVTRRTSLGIMGVG